ncbi:hypothetical protein SH501x_001103 [Pirellulaceae bacterium SH501]
MSSIFLPIRLLMPAVAIEGRKIGGGKKMKSKSSYQFSLGCDLEQRRLVLLWPTRSLPTVKSDGPEEH